MTTTPDMPRDDDDELSPLLSEHFADLAADLADPYRRRVALDEASDA